MRCSGYRGVGTVGGLGGHLKVNCSGCIRSLRVSLKLRYAGFMLIDPKPSVWYRHMDVLCILVVEFHNQLGHARWTRLLFKCHYPRVLKGACDGLLFTPPTRCLRPIWLRGTALLPGAALQTGARSAASFGWGDASHPVALHQ